MSYSQLIAALDKANVALDRKILSDLAISDPAAFKKVVETAQAPPSGGPARSDLRTRDGPRRVGSAETKLVGS